jgi:hypothetical protein
MYMGQKYIQLNRQYLSLVPFKVKDPKKRTTARINRHARTDEARRGAHGVVLYTAVVEPRHSLPWCPESAMATQKVCTTCSREKVGDDVPSNVLARMNGAVQLLNAGMYKQRHKYVTYVCELSEFALILRKLLPLVLRFFFRSNQEIRKATQKQEKGLFVHSVILWC